MKKIDILIIRSFVPPFIMAFFIALFVLVMQFLWKFIDDIVGKGLSFFDLGELLFYRSLSLFPLALPIGVLLAGVMVIGNMSEKYELSSLKSAGISLFRVLLPAIILSICIAAFSFYCSNTLIPISNLKFQSRLYDIRVQKPALNIEEGVFNDDFKGFSIHIGEKAPDNRFIADVLIFNNTAQTKGKLQLVSAKSGEMYYTEDRRFFVMKLYDGYQYQEMENRPGEKGMPFARTNFKEWIKEFDMSEFDLRDTDEDLFKSHHMMKSVSQLAIEIDTLAMKYEDAKRKNYYDFAGMFSFSLVGLDTISMAAELAKEESQLKIEADRERRLNTSPGRQQSTKRSVPPLERALDSLTRQEITPNTRFASHFNASDIRQFAQRGKQLANSVISNSERNQRIMENILLNRRKHIYELHSKFSLAAVCIVFLFIGGPMGAIVRKGGFGYPLLIAIFFFTTFIILNILCKKLNESGSLHPILAAWLPNLILAPVSIVLAFKAMNDSKLLDADRYLKPVIRLFSKDVEVNETPA